MKHSIYIVCGLVIIVAGGLIAKAHVLRQDNSSNLENELISGEKVAVLSTEEKKDPIDNINEDSKILERNSTEPASKERQATLPVQEFSFSATLEDALLRTGAYICNFERSPGLRSDVVYIRDGRARGMITGDGLKEGKSINLEFLYDGKRIYSWWVFSPEGAPEEKKITLFTSNEDKDFIRDLTARNSLGEMLCKSATVSESLFSLPADVIPMPRQGEDSNK